MDEYSAGKILKKRNDAGPVVKEDTSYYCGHCCDCKCFKYVRKTLLFHLGLIAFVLGALFTHVTLEILKG